MNKNVKRAGRTVISSVLILGLVFGNSAFVEAKKVNKNESVYVTAGADGTAQDVVVADWLKDAKGVTGALKDSSNLTDIENVKGEEAFSQSGDELEWNTAGADIYYQGKTDKEIPVEVKITYTLDGQEMTAQEMLGKSGKAEIHVQYINKSKTTKKVNGKEVEIYTPFVMVTGMILTSDVFSTVEIDNGKVVNDGTNQIVVGVGVPGFAESLDLDDEYADKMTSDFTVTADVTDFEMANTFTYGSPSLLDDLNLDEIGDLDELEEKLDMLVDATGELLDGTDSLSKNMKKFDSKMGELKSSVKKFRKDGVKPMADGVSSLAKGGKKLTKGVKSYTSGVTTLAKGSKAYVAGADKIAKGNSSLYEALKDMPSQLEQFNAGLTTYTAAVDKLGSKENVTGLKNGASAVSDGIATLHGSVAQLRDTYENNEKLIAGLKAVIAQLPDSDGYKATQTELLTQLETLTTAQKEALDKISAATADTSDLKTGADTVAASVATVMDSLETLSGNSSSLTEAAKKISTSMPELIKNVKALRDGGVQLTKNDKKLVSGANALIKAGKTMNKSVKKVNGGVKVLKKGGVQLNKAAGKLVKGVVRLEDAGGRLSDGAKELDDGMNEFNADGIEKLNRIYEEDLQNVLDRLDAVLQAGRDYKNFSGLGAGMDGEVKFIIETEAVKKEEQE